MMKLLNYLIGVAISALLLTAGTAVAQERLQADVRIQPLNVWQFSSFLPAPGNYLNCDVTVTSDNDDSAGNVVLHVLLPVEVWVTSASPGCAAVPTTAGAHHGSVVCHLGTINVGQSRAVRITTTLPRLSAVPKTFGAFAWSLTPDPIPGNNYREATITP